MAKKKTAKKKTAKKTAKKKTAKKTAKKTRRRSKGAKRNRVPLSESQRLQFGASDLKQIIKRQKAELEKLADAVQEVKKLKKKVSTCEKKVSESAPGAGKGKRRGKKRPRPGTKSKACSPFSTRRTKPVKCRPKPSVSSLDACGLAARRHGEDPRETCGPGLPRPPGRKLAEKRWEDEGKRKEKPKKRRNFGIHSSAWGD